MLYDDRKINKSLLSILLIVTGFILICDSLLILGFSEVENLKSIILVCLFFIGLISTKIIGDYKNERKNSLQKRNDKNGKHENF